MARNSNSSFVFKGWCDKACLRLVTRVPLSFYEQRRSYSAQLLRITCRLQQRSLNTDMTLGKRSRSVLLKNVLVKTELIHFFDGECAYFAQGLHKECR